MTHEQIEKWIEVMKSAGLLDAIDAKEIESIMQSLNPDKIYDAVSLLWKFRESMYSFDSEYLSYGTLSERFTDLMSGIFTFISPAMTVDSVMANREVANDDTPYNHINLTFRVDGQTHSVTMEDLGDWLDIITLMRFVNGIMSAMGNQQQLYGVDSGDQGVILIKQTPAQYEALKASQLFDVRPF